MAGDKSKCKIPGDRQEKSVYFSTLWKPEEEIVTKLHSTSNKRWKHFADGQRTGHITALRYNKTVGSHSFDISISISQWPEFWPIGSPSPPQQ